MANKDKGAKGHPTCTLPGPRLDAIRTLPRPGLGPSEGPPTKW